jgi:hypothetical protein
VSPDNNTRKIAQAFGVSYDALHRHIKNGHIARAITKREEHKAERELRDLAAESDETLQLIVDLYKRNEAKNDRLALDALNSMFKGREFIAKLTGAFAPERKDITIQEMDISDEELLERAAALDARRKGTVDRADN